MLNLRRLVSPNILQSLCSYKPNYGTIHACIPGKGPGFVSTSPDSSNNRQENQLLMDIAVQLVAQVDGTPLFLSTRLEHGKQLLSQHFEWLFEDCFIDWTTAIRHQSPTIGRCKLSICSMFLMSGSEAVRVKDCVWIITAFELMRCKKQDGGEWKARARVIAPWIYGSAIHASKHTPRYIYITSKWPSTANHDAHAH